MAAAAIPCHAARRPVGENAGVVAPPPLLFAAGLGAGLLLNLLLPPLPITGEAATIIAVVLGTGAGLLAASFVLAFRRSGTAVDPGRPSTALVTTGPYRLTRNPGYVAMAGAYISITIATLSLGAAVLLLPTLYAVDCGVIQREERYLEALFGDDYRRYRARVRRWL
jgi:LPXTG-motif cell wall-anchored protein